MERRALRRKNIIGDYNTLLLEWIVFEKYPLVPPLEVCQSFQEFHFVKFYISALEILLLTYFLLTLRSVGVLYWARATCFGLGVFFSHCLIANLLLSVDVEKFNKMPRCRRENRAMRPI